MKRLATTIAGVAVVSMLAGCGIRQTIFGTAAEKSLALLQVRGFTRTGQVTNDSEPAGTDSIIAYIGPVLSRPEIARRITGPGVSVTMFIVGSPFTSGGGIPGTIWIGRGQAPEDCKLGIDEYVGPQLPFSSWGITRSELTQIRSRKRMLLLVDAACGTG